MSGDSPTDDARAAARARLAARAAHVEGGLAAAAAAEAAVASVAAGRGGDELRPVLSNVSANVPAKTPATRAGFKRHHIVSPPLKNARVKNDDGSGVNIARAARDLCGDLGEPKESLMRRALEVIGVVEANDIAIQVYRIEGEGGQMTSDGARRRTPGGVFWALLRERVTKEEWADIFAEEKEVQRERCRRRRRAASAAASLAGSPTFREGFGKGGVNVNGPASSSLKTPAPIAAAARLAANADAPARATMASKLRDTAAAFTTAVAATPAAAPGSWAARARAPPAFSRAQSAPAAVLASAAENAAKTPTAAAAPATPATPFGVVTPENDPNASKGVKSWAQRARAAAEAEAAAVEARKIAAYKERLAKQNAKLATEAPPPPVVNVEAPAPPVDAMDADVQDGEDWAAEMETEDAGAIAAGTPAANPWAGMASFASMVRA